jgi:hypothetical protein
MARTSASTSDWMKELKDCLDTLEKLKTLRRETKLRLSRDDLEDIEEENYAQKLFEVSSGIKHLEGIRSTLLRRNRKHLA